MVVLIILVLVILAICAMCGIATGITVPLFITAFIAALCMTDRKFGE